jgi:ribonuclease III
MNRPAGSLDKLETALGHRFTNPDLLRQALTHASAATHSREPSNERLEFLGDRVLGLVMARLLHDEFTDEEEGDLARRFAFLVRRDALADVAARIDLADHVAVSAGEEGAGGRDNPALLADACEAVIAALYLDGGLAVAEVFIHRQWRSLIDADPTPPQDSKTALQEWAQARGLALPAYRELDREGPAHAPQFRVEVSVAGEAPESGTGGSKKAAETTAADVLLQRIIRDDL